MAVPPAGRGAAPAPCQGLNPWTPFRGHLHDLGAGLFCLGLQRRPPEAIQCLRLACIQFLRCSCFHYGICRGRPFAPCDFTDAYRKARVFSSQFVCVQSIRCSCLDSRTCRGDDQSPALPRILARCLADNQRPPPAFFDHPTNKKDPSPAVREGGGGSGCRG